MAKISNPKFLLAFYCFKNSQKPCHLPGQGSEAPSQGCWTAQCLGVHDKLNDLDQNLGDRVRTESISDMGHRPGGAYDSRNSDDTHYYYYYYCYHHCHHYYCYYYYYHVLLGR